VAGLTASFAVFLVWHLIRFHYRVVLKRRLRPSSGKTSLNGDLR
jgi:hypothetical protein